MLPPQLGNRPYVDMRVTKRVDAASSDLRLAGVNGTQFSCINVHLGRGTGFLYADYVFHDDTFSKDEPSGTGATTETLTISYGSVEWQYQPLDANGQPAGALVQGSGQSSGAASGGSSGGGGGHKGLIAGIVVVLLVLGGGGAAAFYFMRRRGGGTLPAIPEYADPPGAQFRFGRRYMPMPTDGSPALPPAPMPPSAPGDPPGLPPIS